MLIINADDLGLNRFVTDRILSCYENKRITSTSAMVFMADSERSAELALNSSLEVGLHLNFTDSFTDPNTPTLLNHHQQRIARFLLKNPYCLVLYNPFMRKDFHYVYKAQYDEFVRLYGRAPSHIDGHRHMHLCTNVLAQKLIPAESRVRRSFSFSANEKGFLNRLYRRAIDVIIRRRYGCTDFFFSIAPVQGYGRMRWIVQLSQSYNVELMVHPQKSDEYEYIGGAEYLKIIRTTTLGGYGAI